MSSGSSEGFQKFMTEEDWGNSAIRATQEELMAVQIKLHNLKKEGRHALNCLKNLICTVSEKLAAYNLQERIVQEVTDKVMEQVEDKVLAWLHNSMHKDILSPSDSWAITGNVTRKRPPACWTISHCIITCSTKISIIGEDGGTGPLNKVNVKSRLPSRIAAAC